MMIVGLFIGNRLEDTQIQSMEEDMIRTASTMLSSSENFSNITSIEEQEEIQNLLDEWKVNSNYQLYAIYGEENPRIIASVNVNQVVDNTGALGYKEFDPELVLTGFSGEKPERKLTYQNERLSEMHIVHPIFDYEGEIDGIFYIIGNLDNINNLLLDFQRIIINATLIALIASIFLGLLLSSSITGPITELTKKVGVVAQGNFSQKVEVKSDDEIGQLASMFNFFTDELQETISEMELERAKLDTIFDYMAEGVIALNVNNELIHANQVASEILELDREDLSKNKINLFNLNIFDIDYNNKSSLEGVVSTDIGDRHYNLIYGPYLDDSKTASGIIIVFQDVSKEHTLDEIRKDFVANVSHELKTPLTTIKTYTETLLSTDLDRETSKKFLQTVDTETDRMTRLVKDLLELSNIDNKTSNINLERINVYNLIKNCLNGLELMKEEKNIKLEFRVQKEYLEITNDRNSLEKVIMNIISNAYKYSDDYGKVVIELIDMKERIKIIIKDQGVGIPYSDQKHIFDRFYRVEKGRSRKAGGTGLGLSISKELVDKLGGSISIKSRPNIGTEVTLIFVKEVNNHDR